MSSGRPSSAPLLGLDCARLLLVDHDAGVRLSLARALESENCRVMLAADGREALDAARNCKLDLVLLDIDLPESSGWTTFERLSTLYPSVPVLLITRRPHLEQVAQRAGAVGLLEKPLNVPALLQCVREALSAFPLCGRAPCLV